MNNLLIIRNVCERLFEELVKELLKNRFTVVSGSFRETDGRKVRVRKAHLRKRKRWRKSASWSALGLMSLLSIRVSQWGSFRAWEALLAIDTHCCRGWLAAAASFSGLKKAFSIPRRPVPYMLFGLWQSHPVRENVQKAYTGLLLVTGEDDNFLKKQLLIFGVD